MRSLSARPSTATSKRPGTGDPDTARDPGDRPLGGLGEGRAAGRGAHEGNHDEDVGPVAGCAGRHGVGYVRVTEDELGELRRKAGLRWHPGPSPQLRSCFHFATRNGQGGARTCHQIVVAVSLGPLGTGQRAKASILLQLAHSLPFRDLEPHVRSTAASKAGGESHPGSCRLRTSEQGVQPD